MKTYFTSDYHLFHNNIIKYCERPFKTIEEMNEAIIKNHNSLVKEEDTVFFLGDFCFTNKEDIIKKLNGHFVFIKGNHDHDNSLKTIIRSCVIKIGGQEIYLVHDPDDYNPKFRINLVAHVHNLWKVKKIKGCTLVNVGVDVWDFKPITIDMILKEIAGSVQ